jgi:indole-3-glycerol phosphate synthase
MDSILEQIIRRKRAEVAADISFVSVEQIKARASAGLPPRDFAAALSGAPPIRLIAEVKKASPSRGVIKEDFDHVAIAKSYEAAGAACISVLTDVDFFQGSLTYLSDIRQAIELPILRKDFVVDSYQVYQARAAGADAVLLIAECLIPAEMKQLHELICELGMTPLVELHELKNLQAVLDLNPRLVGINNRNLNTFETNIQHTIEMRRRIPEGILVVGESGIFTRQDALLLESNSVDAMLVGESLMRSDDIETAVKLILAD